MSHQRKIVLMGQGLGVGQHDNGLGCYSALEKLKRTADKLIFDQETTVNNMKQYKDKLQVAEQEVLVLSEQLRVQRNENAKLKAQTQDDQRQINYVSDKVKIVQTLYENMESIVNKLKMETNQNEAYYEALAQNLKTKTSYCEIFVADVESLQNEYQSAISEIKIKESLIVSLEEQVIKIQKAVDQEQLLKNDALSNVQHLEAQQKRLNSEIMSIKDQYDKLQTKMHEDRNEFMQNELNLREQIGVLQKNIQQLEQKEIQLKNQITQLEDELEHAFRKHQSDDTTIIGLRKERDALQQNLKDSRAHLKSSTAQILSLKCKVEELRKGIKDGEICLEDTRSKLDLLNKKYEEVSNEQKESQLSLAEHREQEEQLELTLYKQQEHTSNLNRKAQALFDVHVMDTDAASYVSRPVANVLSQAENEKISKYRQACERRRASFTPIVLSTDGVLGKEAESFVRQLGVHLSEKWKKGYGKVMGWLRIKVQMAALRGASMCLRGSRRKWRTLGTEDGAGITWSREE
eukprot:TRINITY_DN1306_c0_g1_i10.p1 TRINITY_DN1306_c0_g1~~TRINITY_DN1306_c0_g1_i10.p1  ORF type:complete len:519 (+),score=51.49 TRINITY_DN1306_c0_g1_i10:243-1799(+)